MIMRTYTLDNVHKNYTSKNILQTKYIEILHVEKKIYSENCERYSNVTRVIDYPVYNLIYIIYIRMIKVYVLYAKIK